MLAIWQVFLQLSAAAQDPRPCVPLDVHVAKVKDELCIFNIWKVVADVVDC